MDRIKKSLALLFISIIVAGAGFVAWHAVQPEPTVVGATAVDETLTAPTFRLVRSLEARVREQQEAPVLTKLGFAYLQSARESSNGDYVDGAERAFRRALDADPEAFDALTGLGMVHALNHQFTDALRLGRQSLEVQPHQTAAYAVVVDALIELGRYEEAVAAAQEMVDRRPDQSSFTRISYLRELHGDVDGALEAMRRAVTAGSGNVENTAWCEVYLGHLQLDRGELKEAERQYRTALLRLPGYGHALAGLARIALEEERFADAIARYEAAVEAAPIPEYVIALGETYAAAGRLADADAKLAEAQLALEEERENGMDVDDELALLLMKRGRELERALALARGAYERRPTVNNASILSWAYHLNGDHEAAYGHALASLRLGTNDATYYERAGEIARAAGREMEARRHFDRAETLGHSTSSADPGDR